MYIGNSDVCGKIFSAAAKFETETLRFNISMANAQLYAYITNMREENCIRSGVAIGAVPGVLFGAVLGVVIKTVGLGTGFGIAVGTASRFFLLGLP